MYTQSSFKSTPKSKKGLTLEKPKIVGARKKSKQILPSDHLKVSKQKNKKDFQSVPTSKKNSN